jgi:hypothetical protein
MSRISIDVTKEQHRLLKAHAALRGKPLSQLVLDALGISTVPTEELWLFDPANKKLVDEIKKSLKETATIDLGSFKKYTEEK